ncbi:MAG: dipicolinate synthase subunit DpsA [Clostridia bacterium]|nr:dipicolinate synthase subunit DpsA [Clostridia bacterium]
MYANVKIGILGGDMRQTALARRLSEKGFEIATWGLSREADIGRAVRCGDWHGAVDRSRAVILPLPASSDGVRVHAPFAAGYELRMSHLMEALAADTLLIGGKFDFGIQEAARENNIPLLDYFECEELQIKNAVPTAEGAIEIAMREMPITVFGSKALVCGYGRIGKVLAAMLKSLGATVTVAARRQEDLAYCTVNGHRAVRFGTEAFQSAAEQAEVVFNTVPAKILDASVVEGLRNCCLIVDLASGKGGTDFDAVASHGIRAIHALSLPGKVAPATAGGIICDCVVELLIREGVIARS